MSIKFQSATAALYTTYTDGSCPHLAYPGPGLAPSQRAIARIHADLLTLTLRAGLDGRPLSARRYRRLTARVRRRLIVQLIRAKRAENDAPPTGTRHWAVAVADQFFDTLAGVRRVLDRDVETLYRADPAAKTHYEVAAVYPGPQAVATYRLAHELQKLNVPLLPRMLTELAHSATGIDLHPGARIGAGFAVDHGTGTVIGETARIGQGVVVYQGVTAGAFTFPRDEDGELLQRGPAVQRHPTIEDGCIIYAHATILGGDTVIRHHTDIGSNVRITKTVEPEMRVLVTETEHKIRPKKAPKNRTKKAPPVPPVTPNPRSEAYYERDAWSDWLSEGGANGGDIDKLDWPPE